MLRKISFILTIILTGIIAPCAFGDELPVVISSNNDQLGTASFQNPNNNQLNKSLTVKAVRTKPAKWNNTNDMTDAYSKSVKFDGWYKKGTDELMCPDMNYTFTVTAPIELEARFHWDGQYISGTDGYYRLRCGYSYYSSSRDGFINGGDKYLNIVGNYKISTAFLTDLQNRDLTPVMYYSPNPYSDPSCILRISGKNFKQLGDTYKSQQTILTGVNLAGQGTSTNGVTGKNFNIESTEQVGLFKMTYNAGLLLGKLALYNGYEGVEHPYGALTISKDYSTGEESMRCFDFLPLDEAHIDEYFFAAEPDENMYYDGGFWSSMFTSFPYKCWEDDGVEAYYISEIDTESSDANNIAILTKIEEGMVPANTPVLLKCQGTDPAHNRLLPLLNDPDVEMEDNLLRGCKKVTSGNTTVKYGFQLKETEKADESKYYKFDGNTMRVFSVNGEGTVGFYKMEEGTMLAANKAWLDISGIPAAASAKKLVLRNGDISGIEDVAVKDNVVENDPNAPVYNLMGQRVLHTTPGQIYIKNGKKFIAK